MPARDLTAEIKAKACARNADVLFGGQATESREESGDVLGPDSYPVVMNSQPGPRTVERDGTGDVASIRRILERVVHQVADHHRDSGAVAFDHDPIAARRHDELVILSQRGEGIQLVGRHRPQVEQLEVQREALVFDAGDLQHLLHQRVHLRELRLDQACHGCDLLSRYGAVLQHRVVAADYGEWSPQLVRRDIQELRLRALEVRHSGGVLPQSIGFGLDLRFASLFREAALGEVSGDLAEASKLPGLVFQRGDDHAGPEPRAVLAEAPALLFVLALALGDDELSSRLAIRYVFGRVKDREVTADDLCRGVALDALRAGVPAADHAFRIEHEDRVVHDARHQKLEPLLAASKALVDDAAR